MTEIEERENDMPKLVPCIGSVEQLTASFFIDEQACHDSDESEGTNNNNSFRAAMERKERPAPEEEDQDPVPESEKTDDEPSVPVHGPGLELDLTGTWSLVWTDDDSDKPVGRLEVEHSSFGHLAGCWQTTNNNNNNNTKSSACHGWFWGSAGYIQIVLDDSETLHHVQLITLRLVGKSSDQQGPMLVLEGERRGEEDVIFDNVKKMTFEITVRPKTYRSHAFGDCATRDIFIKVQDSSFHVHTAIIATFIPHMRRVLDSGMEESETYVIPCPGDSPHAWRVLLERIYDVTGCFHASAALKVLPILNKYQVPKLWAEAVAELKRLPQNPRPHPHVLDLLCRCEGQEVIEHWFTAEPPDAEELVLFIRECSDQEATRIVAQKSADSWRREVTDLTTKLSHATSTARNLQHHIDAVHTYSPRSMLSPDLRHSS
eukprot:TRINITY_DN11900_c4_g2_i1.p1 TRINITY_DN11900_c4_g2~~TRINITY_DN11900_c4_g2_i1.p1  ORF type:complete len:461 (+),score=80.11 TRINITY_DN11900_c4_g2_i1:93-1385(+)